MAGPFTFQIILIVARSYNVTSSDVRFVNPILIQQDVVLPAAAETAIQNVIASFERQPGAFADDHRARAQLLAQYSKAPDLRLGRYGSNNLRNCAAVAKNIVAFSSDSGDAETIISDGQIVCQLQPLK